ncbi:MAG: DNA polymerase III subunit delta' [Alphaproteobacteria bacterium]|nr:DNA polymerase III subunit delta' [Alphaproteobacteria bacterium]
MENIAPKDNTYLLGHEEQEKFILNAWREHKLHQSLLISGPKGIGKATFAYRIARFLLQADESKSSNYKSLEVAADDKTFRQVSSGAHPDFKVVERGYIKTDRQKIYKAVQSGNYMTEDELDNLKKSTEIVVDDVREVNDFLAKSSADGNWRIVLVDSADEMNRASANALLKILEEPPHKTLMLLIAHNPARLLPTIRSRCAKLELKPLKDNQVASLLRRYRAELSEAEIKKISAMAEGSIGKAMIYADGGAVDFYEKMGALIGQGSNFRTGDMLKFCDMAAKDDNYDLFKEMVIKFLTEQVRGGRNVEQYADLFGRAVQSFREAESLNMDKKQVVTNIMVALARMEQK